ncbi:Ricin-type beta-trefoil lectin domain-like [Rhizoctonia solani]|uniref:Ricin-type beta-trefoil lectin domain-like n=1 Tax=Rhizoctonia solani TaxID=456999 RepID=A0A8H7M6X5_9AGAM|nr:Ricin-type beta-trefoil lectin domain-like [Rhizoctonia solani]
MTIVPGTYRIKNAKSWTTFDQSRKDRNKIHGWQERTDQQNQHWYVQRIGEAYHIKNVETGQYAHVDGGYNSSKLQASGSPTTWYLPQEGDGSVFVTLAGTNFVVDLDMGKADNGTTIHLWEKTGAKQQKWFFEKINDNAGQQQQSISSSNLNRPTIRHLNSSNSNLSINNPNSPSNLSSLNNPRNHLAPFLPPRRADEGADVFGYKHNGGNNQKWLLQPSGRGQNMTLKNVQANTYASFPGQSFAQGILVKASQQAQEYTIRAADKGFYVQPTDRPGFVLDLVHGSDDNGTKICVWQNNQQDNQKWYFERA